jgi:predicted Fe-Mo cluster-binding NifX family protein
MKFKTAIASSDMKNVDTHFGKCAVFVIAEVDDEDGSYRLSETRPVTPPCPSCGTRGEADDAIGRVAASLSDCEYVITSRIGRWPDSLLLENGIRSLIFGGPISDAVPLLLAERKNDRSSEPPGADL